MHNKELLLYNSGNKNWHVIIEADARKSSTAPLDPDSPDKPDQDLDNVLKIYGFINGKAVAPYLDQPVHIGCINKLPYWNIGIDNSKATLNALYSKEFGAASSNTLLYFDVPVKPTIRKITVSFYYESDKRYKVIELTSSSDGSFSISGLRGIDFGYQPMYFHFDPAPDGYYEGVYTTKVSVRDNKGNVLNGAKFAILYSDDPSEMPTPPALQIFDNAQSPKEILVTYGKAPKYVVMAMAPSGFTISKEKKEVDIYKSVSYTLNTGTVLPG